MCTGNCQFILQGLKSCFNTLWSLQDRYRVELQHREWVCSDYKCIRNIWMNLLDLCPQKKLEMWFPPLLDFHHHCDGARFFHIDPWKWLRRGFSYTFSGSFIFQYVPSTKVIHPEYYKLLKKAAQHSHLVR